MNDNLITIAKFRFEYRAYLLKDKLEDAGIECYVTNKSVFFPADGVMVLICEKDCKIATPLLEEFDADMKNEETIDESENEDNV